MNWKDDISWSQLETIAPDIEDTNGAKIVSSTRTTGEREPQNEDRGIPQEQLESGQLESLREVSSIQIIPSDCSNSPQVSLFRNSLHGVEQSVLGTISEETTLPSFLPGIASTTITGEKKRERSLDQDTEREVKRLKEVNNEEEVAPIVPFDDPENIDEYQPQSQAIEGLPPQPDVLCDVSSSDSQSINLTDVLLSPTSWSDVSLVAGHTLIASNSSIEADIHGAEELVLDPRRLQRILESIGILWDLDTITQCVRKDIVFRTSTPPKYGLPEVACATANLKKIQTFADFLFNLTIFEDAFPLFLQVWVRRRGEIGYNGTYLGSTERLD